MYVAPRDIVWSWDYRACVIFLIPSIFDEDMSGLTERYVFFKNVHFLR